MDSFCVVNFVDVETVETEPENDNVVVSQLPKEATSSSSEISEQQKQRHWHRRTKKDLKLEKKLCEAIINNDQTRTTLLELKIKRRTRKRTLRAVKKHEKRLRKRNKKLGNACTEDWLQKAFANIKLDRRRRMIGTSSAPVCSREHLKQMKREYREQQRVKKRQDLHNELTEAVLKNDFMKAKILIQRIEQHDRDHHVFPRSRPSFVQTPSMMQPSASFSDFGPRLPFLSPRLACGRSMRSSNGCFESYTMPNNTYTWADSTIRAESRFEFLDYKPREICKLTTTSTQGAQNETQIAAVTEGFTNISLEIKDPEISDPESAS